MKIRKIQTQPNFAGKIYTLKNNIPLMEFSVLERNSEKLIQAAKVKKCDFVIFKNGLEKGLSILAKAPDAARCVMEVLGYPSGHEAKDIKLIIETMNKSEKSFEKEDSMLGWSCE